MNKARYLPLLVICVLLLWLAFLFYKSSLIDWDSYNGMVSSIQQLKRFDALLNQDILEVRYQSQLNMDAISRHSDQTLKLLSTLKEALTARGVSTGEQIALVEKLFSEKFRLIEQFKSHNAILRNSLHYLPGAVEKQARAEEGQVSQDLSKLMERLLVYNLSPDPAMQKKIQQRLQQLSSSTKANGIKYIIMHAEAVIREHSVVSSLMHRLIELPTSQGIKKVSDSYDGEYQAVIENAATYRVFLFLFAIVLFVYVVFLFRKQGLTAKALAQSVRDLEFQKYALDQHAIVSITDRRGVITYANDKFSELSQHSVEALTGAKQRIVNSQYHPASFFKEMWRMIGQGEVWRGEVYDRAKNGDGYWVDTTIVPFLDDHGKPFQYIAIQTDISKLKNTQETLLREHQLLERILATIPSILIGINADDEVNLWNHASEAAFGISQQQALGKRFSTLDIAWDWSVIDKAITESRNIGMGKFDHTKFVRTDKTEGFVGGMVSTIHEQGKYAGMLLLASDITKKTQLATQLQLSQKMEAVGELAAGIAHEINTPLQYVGDNLRFLRDSFEDMLKLHKKYQGLKNDCAEQGLAGDWVEKLNDAENEADSAYLLEEIPSAIAQSLDGVDKAANIVGAMKEFSHPSKEMNMIDINKAIENTITISRNEWKYVADVETVLDEHLPLAECLPEVNQVFLNMIVNAAHAIEEKLGQDSVDKGLITIRTSHTNGYVQIEISDTGKGIPEGLQGRVFDPFFTTKEVGKGTGQGLAISHNIIVEKHAGTLQLSSEEGCGTKFSIRLPIKQKCHGGTDEC